MNRRRNASWGGSGLAIGVPVAIAMALSIGGFLLPTRAVDRSPGPVPVHVAAYSCPLTGGLGVTAGQVVAGESASAVLVPSGKQVDSLADAKTWRFTQPSDGVAMRVEQRGRRSGAVGFVAGRAPSSEGGGLAVGQCPTVSDESWFLGLGSGRKHESSIVLTNFGSSIALADVHLWAPDGPVAAVDNRGIIVEPHSARRIQLDQLAAGEPTDLAVQVIRRRGSLAVAAFDSSRSALKGTETPAGALPGRRVVLPGVPGGVRSLLLLNTGTGTARISVRVRAEFSSFTPQSLASIKLSPDRLAEVPVPASAGSKPVTLTVISDEPVVATVRVAGSRDFSYAVAGVPVRETAVVPVALGVPIDRPKVMLTAGDRPTTVTVTGYDQSMHAMASIRREVAADRTQVVDLANLGKGVAYATVTGTRPFYAAAIFESGKQLAVLPLTDAPLSRPGPDVRPVD